jgi:hypothetical protein
MKKLVNNRLTHFLEEKGYLPTDEAIWFSEKSLHKGRARILESQIQEVFR